MRETKIQKLNSRILLYFDAFEVEGNPAGQLFCYHGDSNGGGCESESDGDGDGYGDGDGNCYDDGGGDIGDGDGQP